MFSRSTSVCGTNFLFGLSTNSGISKEPQSGPGVALAIAERFEQIRRNGLPGLVYPGTVHRPQAYVGTASLGKRVQPFTLLLKSLGSYPLVRCISPVGCVNPSEDQESLVDSEPA